MKRFLSIVLALAMTLGLTLTSFANDPGLPDVYDDYNDYNDGYIDSFMIADINERAFPNIYGQVEITQDGDDISFSDLSDLEVEPGDEIRIYLSPYMFMQDDNTTATGNINDPLPLSALHGANVRVGSSLSTNTDVADIILAGNSDQSYISIQFTDMAGHQNCRFRYTVFLAVGSRRNSNTRIDINGVIRADEMDFDSDHRAHPDNPDYTDLEYVDISGGQVLTAREDAKAVKIHLGSDCFITANLKKGLSYHGTASTVISKHDQALFSKYSSLKYIYTVALYGGLTAYDYYMSFDKDRTYYVYDMYGKYAGTTNDKLLYSTKYYLTTTYYTSIKVIK